MESVKTVAKRIAENLPEDATWQQYLDRVIVSAKLAQGMEELERGEGIPHEVVKKEMDEWLKSSGHRKPSTTINAS